MPGPFVCLLPPPRPQSGRSHWASDSGSLGAAFSFCWSRDTSLGPAGPERPKTPRRWARILEMHRVYICDTDEENPKFLRIPVIWEGAGDSGASEAGHKSKDTDMDIDTEVAETKRWAQMV